jgi:hypothetical protein
MQKSFIFLLHSFIALPDCMDWCLVKDYNGGQKRSPRDPRAEFKILFPLINVKQYFKPLLTFSE